MIRIAIKMIVNDRLKYLGLLVGLAFAATLITQQASIFMGYTQRMWAFFSDTPHTHIWVMDNEMEFSEDAKALPDSTLYLTRSVEGVEWAMPMYRAVLLAKLADGSERASRVIGIDDGTLMGAPTRMLSGRVEDLREAVLKKCKLRVKILKKMSFYILIALKEL
jgi:putative ABC transport system permease protein